MVKVIKHKIWWIVTAVVWFIFHLIHDVAWVLVGRWTNFDIQETLPAAAVVSLLMAVITHKLGKHLNHH